MIARSIAKSSFQQKIALVWSLSCAIGIASGCAQTKADGKPSSTVQPSTAPVQEAGSPGKAPQVAESIGSATMKADGTIVLQLRAADQTGRRGDAQIVYPPSHPQYQEVLKHLGGLKPGEEKHVPPWPE